jgi:hypothetical protein
MPILLLVCSCLVVEVDSEEDLEEELAEVSVEVDSEEDLEEELAEVSVELSEVDSPVNEVSNLICFQI